MSGVTRVNGSEAQCGKRAVVEQQRVGIAGQTGRVQILACQHPTGAEPVDEQVDLSCQIRPAKIGGRVHDERHGQDGRTVRTGCGVGSRQHPSEVTGGVWTVPESGAADGVVFGAGENGREQTFTARRDQ